MVRPALVSVVKRAHMYVLVASDPTLHMPYELRTVVRLARPSNITRQFISSSMHSTRTKEPT